MALRVRVFTDRAGRSPFTKWFDRLSRDAAARIATALYRLEAGNLSNVKSVGGGVCEFKVDFGPGLRIYFGRDGRDLIILLGGSSKSDQQEAIERAKQAWAEYKLAKHRAEGS